MNASVGGRLRLARSVVYAEATSSLPGWACQALAAVAPDTRVARSVADTVDEARRSRPTLVLLHVAEGPGDAALSVLHALKRDAYTAVIPCVVLHRGCDNTSFLRAGADDVIECGCTTDAEGMARIEAAVRRSTRDLSAQPTTRLPGAGAIEAEITRRLGAGEEFAACYADLDHFKEFNDRYGYHEGDRVIRMVGRVLHDTAAGIAGDQAFVGHVGGDDFMLVLPLEVARPACELALEVFDMLVPYQYTNADRRAGYYFGKDRRGQLHRVPLMTLSIGVATTERRRFDSAADVSRLASEMKSFAKARPGSVLAVDRRGEQDARLSPAGQTRNIPKHSHDVDVSCPECQSVFRVDPAKVPARGVHARCSVCGAVIPVHVSEVVASVVSGVLESGSSTPGWSTSTVTPETAAPAESPAETDAGTSPVPSPAVPRASTAAEAEVAITVVPRVAPERPTEVPGEALAVDPRPQPVHERPATSQPELLGWTTPPPPADPRPPQPRVAPRRVNPYLSNDPAQKARRLARALVSDLVAYNPQKREEGLRAGTLKDLFREDIRKSWQEYVDQVGATIAESTPHFQEALNDILAGGRRIF